MSVASVASQWTLPVSIADELESFFHVMLFYGVRYLPHTLPSVSEFVIDYFDTFQQNEAGRRLCSSLKEAAMQSKMLVYAGKDLRFLKTTGQRGNPMNALINSLLELFQARYQVINHNNALEEALQVQNAAHPSSSAPQGKALKKSTLAVQPWMDDCDPDPTIDEVEEDEPLLEPPSSKTVKLAAQLNTHRKVLQLFGLIEALDEARWVDTGVVGKDQLVNYDPRPRFVAEACTANRAKGTTGTLGSRASKRAKTEHSDSAFDAVAPAVIFGGFTTAPAVMTVGRKGKGRA